MRLDAQDRVCDLKLIENIFERVFTDRGMIPIQGICNSLLFWQLAELVDEKYTQRREDTYVTEVNGVPILERDEIPRGHVVFSLPDSSLVVVHDILTNTWTTDLKARVDLGVLRLTPQADHHPTHEPITRVRVVSVAECICGHGPTFCSCTKCRSCGAVVDAGVGAHVCPGQRELTPQERSAWRRCPSVSPKTGAQCDASGVHDEHYSRASGQNYERWTQNWQQPPQLYADEAAEPATDKQKSDLGGLLSEIIWEQRRMGK